MKCNNLLPNINIRDLVERNKQIKDRMDDVIAVGIRWYIWDETLAKCRSNPELSWTLLSRLSDIEEI